MSWPPGRLRRVSRCRPPHGRAAQTTAPGERSTPRDAGRPPGQRNTTPSEHADRERPVVPEYRLPVSPCPAPSCVGLHPSLFAVSALPSLASLSVSALPSLASLPVSAPPSLASLSVSARRRLSTRSSAPAPECPIWLTEGERAQRAAAWRGEESAPAAASFRRRRRRVSGEGEEAGRRGAGTRLGRPLYGAPQQPPDVGIGPGAAGRRQHGGGDMSQGLSGNSEQAGRHADMRGRNSQQIIRNLLYDMFSFLFSPFSKLCSQSPIIFISVFCTIYSKNAQVCRSSFDSQNEIESHQHYSAFEWECNDGFEKNR